MTTPSFLSLFPMPQNFLALTPEDLSGAIIEVVPPLIQNGMFNIHSLLSPLYEPPVPFYPRETRRPVMLAFAEALSWLTTNGLIVIVSMAETNCATEPAWCCDFKSGAKVYRSG